MKGFTCTTKQVSKDEYIPKHEINFTRRLAMPFHSQISENTHMLNKNENELLAYCMKHSDQVFHMKISDLATTLYTSPASLVRFCKKLGFSGFSEFKAALKFETNANHELVESHSSDLFKDSEKTIQLVNESIVEQLIDLIHEKHRIEFYAVGSSRMVANEITKKFQSIGKLAFCYDDSSLMNISAKALSSQDMVIAFSTSGETNLIISACSQAKAMKASIISITDLSNNTLSRTADLSLYASSTSFVKADICIRSRLQLLMIAEYIFFRYIEKYYEQL